MDEYQHLRESADRDREAELARQDLERERSRDRWHEAMLHSEARARGGRRAWDQDR